MKSSLERVIKNVARQAVEAREYQSILLNNDGQSPKERDWQNLRSNIHIWNFVAGYIVPKGLTSSE